MIHFIKCLTVSSVSRFIRVRSSAFFETCPEVDGKSQVFGHQEVEIGTESETLEAGVRLVSVFVLTEFLEQSLLVIIFGRSKVTHTFRTALYIDIVALCRCTVSQNGVIPVYIRVEEGIYSAELSC